MQDDDVTVDGGCVIPWLGVGDPFPPLEEALVEPNGLLAAGADLSPERLIAAYSSGIFPWFDEREPVLWWSPDPRMVLFLPELHVSRSLERLIKRRAVTLTLDEAFGDVMTACAGPRREQRGTWITGQMLDAYAELARRGYAHSVEAWSAGALVGGLYGVAIGRMFFGESMFSRVPSASKMALVGLVRQLARWQFEIIDCQMPTPHLASLGAREIPRSDFAAHVARLVRESGPPVPWRFDPDLYNGSKP